MKVACVKSEALNGNATDSLSRIRERGGKFQSKRIGLWERLARTLGQKASVMGISYMYILTYCE